MTFCILFCDNNRMNKLSNKLLQSRVRQPARLTSTICWIYRVITRTTNRSCWILDHLGFSYFHILFIYIWKFMHACVYVKNLHTQNLIKVSQDTKCIILFEYYVAESKKEYFLIQFKEPILSSSLKYTYTKSTHNKSSIKLYSNSTFVCVCIKIPYTRKPE